MEPTLRETPTERAEREALERAAADSPLRGRPLPRRARLGRTTLERYLAAAGGPPAYMRRLRVIEDRIRAHERALLERWRELAAARSTDERFAEDWQLIAEGWDLSDVNDLVEQHNRWYAVEANLAMDPRTGDFALVGGRPYTRDRLDSAWIVRCYPPRRELALV